MLRAAKEFAIGTLMMLVIVLAVVILSSRLVNAQTVLPPLEYDHP